MSVYLNLESENQLEWIEDKSFIGVLENGDEVSIVKIDEDCYVTTEIFLIYPIKGITILADNEQRPRKNDKRFSIIIWNNLYSFGKIEKYVKRDYFLRIYKDNEE